METVIRIEYLTALLVNLSIREKDIYIHRVVNEPGVLSICHKGGIEICRMSGTLNVRITWIDIPLPHRSLMQVDIGVARFHPHVMVAEGQEFLSDEAFLVDGISDFLRKTQKVDHL